MKYLIGYGLGKLPVYDPVGGQITLKPPFGSIKLEDISLVMNVTQNTIFHIEGNSEVQLADLSYSGDNCILDLNQSNIGAAEDIIHVWADVSDGVSYSNDTAQQYLQSLNLALTSNLKFDNSNGTLNLDFSGSETNIENAINQMNASIQTMTTAINDLAAVPDTELLQTAGAQTTYSIATTPGWSASYSEMVSIRSLSDTTAFVLKKATNVVVDDGGSPYQLEAGEYLDIKFDEIILEANSKVIVTFLDA